MPMLSRTFRLALAGTAVIGCIGLTSAIARAETWEDDGAQVEAEADDWGPAEEDAYVGEEGSNDATVPDLDAYDEEQLYAELEDELDDIYQDHQIDPYGEYDIDALRAWFLECLMSDSDNNPEVTYANLQEEMAEAGTTLEDAIDEGLAEADLMSSTNTRLPGLGHAVALGLASSGATTIGMESRANRRARASDAVARVKFSISRGVFRRR
jgi:hypothetical protein